MACLIDSHQYLLISLPYRYAYYTVKNLQQHRTMKAVSTIFMLLLLARQRLIQKSRHIYQDTWLVTGKKNWGMLIYVAYIPKLILCLLVLILIRPLN